MPFERTIIRKSRARRPSRAGQKGCLETPWLWCAEQPTLSDVVESGRLSQHGGSPLSDDDAARLRERLLVSPAIEEFRRAHRYPRRDEAAKRRTRTGHRCMDRAQGSRRPQGLCVLGQGASEAQGKEQAIIA